MGLEELKELQTRCKDEDRLEDVLLEQVKRSEDKVKSLERDKKYNLIFAVLLAAGTITTASLQLYFGMGACAIIWLGWGLYKIITREQKSHGRPTGEYFIDEGLVSYKLMEKLDDGSSKIIARYGTYERSHAELKRLLSYEKKKM